MQLRLVFFLLISQAHFFLVPPAPQRNPPRPPPNGRQHLRHQLNESQLGARAGCGMSGGQWGEEVGCREWALQEQERGRRFINKNASTPLPLPSRSLPTPQNEARGAGAATLSTKRPQDRSAFNNYDKERVHGNCSRPRAVTAGWGEQFLMVLVGAPKMFFSARGEKKVAGASPTHARAGQTRGSTRKVHLP